MYGTVARLQLKPGVSIQAFKKLSDEDTGMDGIVGSYLYQMDTDSNILYLVVMFTSRESYHKNAQSPDQNDRFLQMMEFLAAEPEWHDGEIIWSFPAA